jgi:hypothetical protein
VVCESASGRRKTCVGNPRSASDRTLESPSSTGEVEVAQSGEIWIRIVGRVNEVLIGAVQLIAYGVGDYE